MEVDAREYPIRARRELYKSAATLVVEVVQDARMDPHDAMLLDLEMRPMICLIRRGWSEMMRSATLLMAGRLVRFILAWRSWE